MSFDYYIQKTIFIEYLDINEESKQLITHNIISEHYLYLPDNEILDDTYEMIDEKFTIELRRKVLLNTYTKKIYDDGIWINKSYKRQYKYLLRECDFCKIIAIYEKSFAWERK